MRLANSTKSLMMGNTNATTTTGAEATIASSTTTADEEANKLRVQIPPPTCPGAVVHQSDETTAIPSAVAAATSSTSGCSPSACSAGSSTVAVVASVPPAPLMRMPFASAAASPRIKEEWFSLEGPLNMKSMSGALYMLQPRKRLYFALEEIDNKLIFYRTKVDFDARKDCQGQIQMNGAFCSLVEGNMRAFMLHTEAGKKFLLEADNERAADCWLNALQQRREDGRRSGSSRNGSIDAGAGGGLPLIPAEGRRHRSRSKSLGQSDSDSELLFGVKQADDIRRQRTRSHYNPQHGKRLAPLQINGFATLNSPTAMTTATSPCTPPTVSGISMSMPAAIDSGANLPPPHHHTCGGLPRRKFSPAAMTITKSPTSTSLLLQRRVAANGAGGLHGSGLAVPPSPIRRRMSATPDIIHEHYPLCTNTNVPASPTCCVCEVPSSPSVPSPLTPIGAGGVNGTTGVGDGMAVQWVLDSWLKDQQEQQQNHKPKRKPSSQRSAGSSHHDQNGAHHTPVVEMLNVSEGIEADLEDHLTASPVPALPSANCCNSSEEDTSASGESAEAMEQTMQERGREEELQMLRKLGNRQKEQILELRIELDRLRKLSTSGGTIVVNEKITPAATNFQCSSIPEDHLAAFAAKSRFLNAELLRVHERKQEADKQIEVYKRKISQLEGEMEEFKKEYVHLLQSCVRIPLRENSSCDVVQVKLYGGDEHERRVKKLLERARESDPTLPTFESVTGRDCFHVDEYGFRHNFEEIPLALHFIATQLHLHYQAQSADYMQLKGRWRAILDAQPERIERNRETRHLCRLGIPRSMRSRVWRLLIHQQVADLKAKYGPYYYRDLCSSQGTPAEKHYSSAHQKQVNLDLLRTMPGNVHFMSASCKGVTHLQSVLRAYCLHNPAIGYCQGMNFLVGTALLFMSPEDAFWFLVALTERYFDSSYFDQNLTGAQADQEVLKEIVEQKLPRLAQHLDECEIDLTTVTLNWFIALFFDAMPFQTMLRLWDCFLMEGPKVLFRFTLAILALYEEDILAHSETISVIKVLKAGVRLTLDVDGLVKLAFEEMDPFPSKAYLRQRQFLYLQVLQERLLKRQQLRQYLNASGSCGQSDQLCDLPIEVVVFSQFVPGQGYVCAGNQKRGKVSQIQLHEDAANLNTLDLEFDCRPVSMVIFQPEMAFLSLLSGYIVALHLQAGDGQAEILWELKLNDVALKLVHCSSRLYSCLANGTLAVLENAFEQMPSALDLYHIPIAAAPITDALVDQEYLYLAVACKVVILNRETLSPVKSVYVASAAAGSQVPMFEKIRALANSPHGIWLATAHSSLLQLWHDGQCEMLFDIRYDHSHRKPSFDELDDDLSQVEVCSILYHADELWVGTVDGYLMLYRVHLVDEFTNELSMCRQFGGGTTAENGTIVAVSKYQPGKRLSPAYGLSHPVPLNRQQTYYIPTENERRAEERNCYQECIMDGPERQARRKISVKIDRSTRKYSVNVLTLRQPSIDSPSMIGSDGPSRLASSSTTSSEPLPHHKQQKSFLFPAPNNAANGHGTITKNALCTQQSVDSALSSLHGGGGCGSGNSRRGRLMDSEKNLKQQQRHHHMRGGSPSTGGVYGTAGFNNGSFDQDEFLEVDSGEEEEEEEELGMEEDDDGNEDEADEELANVRGKLGTAVEDAVKMIGQEQEAMLSGQQQQQKMMATMAEEQRRRFASKLVRINSWRRMSSVSLASTPTLQLNKSGSLSIPHQNSYVAPDECRKFSCSLTTPGTTATCAATAQLQPTISSENQGSGSGVRIRRKDLDFDEPLLLAVKDGESLLPSLGASPPTRRASLCQKVINTFENTNGTTTSNNNNNPNRSNINNHPIEGPCENNMLATAAATAVANELVETTEIKNSLGMALQMKLKVADKPVRCIAFGKFADQDVIVTGAGEYGDEEALLRWRRDPNSALWINDPLVDIWTKGRKWGTALASPTRRTNSNNVMFKY